MLYFHINKVFEKNNVVLHVKVGVTHKFTLVVIKGVVSLRSVTMKRFVLDQTLRLFKIAIILSIPFVQNNNSRMLILSF